MAPAALRTAVAAALAPLADPARAAAMAAYMKQRFEFLGVPTPPRRAATRALWRGFDGNAAAAARSLWRAPHREFQYVACDLLRDRADDLPAAALDDLLALAVRKSWWDSVDALAASVGILVRRHRRLQRAMDRLIDDPNPWLRRIALLHQLGWQAETDTARLFDYCLRRGGDDDFFIRKGIGWALRDFAWHDGKSVGRFVAAHRAELSPLSCREATRNLDIDRP